MKGWTVLAVIALLLFAGCSGKTSNPANPNAKYFTGTEGVEASFENLPAKIYYYSEDTSANEFSFGIELRNNGASFTRGGIYLSGFDPNLIVFEGMDLDNTRAPCGISFGNIGMGQFGAFVRCDNLQVGVEEGRGITDIRLDSLAQFISEIRGEHEVTWLDPEKFDFSFDYSDRDGGGSWMINLNNIQGNLEYYQHGRLFIALLSGLNFKLNHGREFLLAGDTYEFPGGEYDYEQYRAKVVDWPPGLDQTTQHLLLTTCYQYTTYADPIVCIDPDPTSDYRKVCVPRSRSWSNQGAPVAITSIEQENTPKKIIFRINVKNVGKGQVYDAGKLEKCSPYYPGRVTPEDLNVVYLGDVRIGQTGLKTRSSVGGMSCYPEVIRLDSKTKSGSTTCTYPIEHTEMKTAYETPLVVELWYGYSQTYKRDINIKRVY
jgi:hypothetical protein